MGELTEQGQQVLSELARRHGVSLDAVHTLARALVAGRGTQAQFSHPDLGGMGQWSSGGMVMVGDMFNHGLKQRVDALCTEISSLLARQPLFAEPAGASAVGRTAGQASFTSLMSSSSSNWWPAELGSPTSSGAQNGLRYAWFAGARRLAIEDHGNLQIFDTGDHAISGFGQQQGGSRSLTLTSQHGHVRVADLPVVEPQASSDKPTQRPVDPASTPSTQAPAAHAEATGAKGDVFDMLERLSDLHRKGVVSAEEFAAKKAELLSRI